MRKITSFFLTMLLAIIALPMQAALNPKVVVDQALTSLDDLQGKTFAIVNKADGKALYGTTNQNLAYGSTADAFKQTNTGYCFRLVKAEGEDVEGCYYLQLVTPAGADYKFGGGGYLNSQPISGRCSFILGLKGQNGQDIKDGAVWDIQYVADKGFTLKNIGTGKYLNDAAPAKYDEPVYWTFYTLVTDYFTPLFEEEEAIKKNGTSEEAIKTYDDAVKDVKASLKDGTIKKDNTEYAKKVDDALNALAKAQTATGSDFTRAIVNPSFETGTLEGWTSNGGGDIAKNMNFNENIAGQKFVEKWTNSANNGKLSDGSLLQTLTGMPNGTYKLTANMQNLEQRNNPATNGSGFFLVINDTKTDCTAPGKVTVTAKVMTGTLKIGVKLEGCTGNWMCVDNFELTYDGPLDPSDLVATPEELKPLTDEIAIAESLGADVTAWKNKSFNAADVADKVNEVKTAEYAAVQKNYTKNAAALIPDFSEWKGDMSSNKGQHWDGTTTSTYWEQLNDGKNNSWGKESWTNSKNTSVKLPKGKYVIYAAGRACAGESCTPYIKVNDVIRNYTAKGDIGLGVTTSGVASFDPNETYANNNKGRGFEYRYVAFEVTAEEGEEVTLEVGGKATAKYQWMSFTTPVLVTTADNAAIEKVLLAAEITEANKTADAAKANVGESIFQIPTDAYKTFVAAIKAAETVNNDANATAEEVEKAKATLEGAVETFKATPAKAPEAGKKYVLVNNSTNNCVLNISTEKILVTAEVVPVTFVAQDGGNYAIANEKNEYVNYKGGNNWDLNATTTAYGWTIAATTGGYTIKGKNGNIGLDKTDSGSTCYGNKSNKNDVWSIKEYVEVPDATIAATRKWGTYITPASVAIPTGLEAYTCEATASDNALQLTKVEGTLEANKAYILYNATKDDVTIPAFGAIAADETSYKTGLLVGTYVNIQAPANSYIMQKQDGKVGFYRCDKADTFDVNAFHCYIANENNTLKSVSFIFDDDTTTGVPSLNASENGAQKDGKIYDINGVERTRLEKGVNIVNGVKVYVK